MMISNKDDFIKMDDMSKSVFPNRRVRGYLRITPQQTQGYPLDVFYGHYGYPLVDMFVKKYF